MTRRAQIAFGIATLIFAAIHGYTAVREWRAIPEMSDLAIQFLARERIEGISGEDVVRGLATASLSLLAIAILEAALAGALFRGYRYAPLAWAAAMFFIALAHSTAFWFEADATTRLLAGFLIAVSGMGLASIFYDVRLRRIERAV